MIINGMPLALASTIAGKRFATALPEVQTIPVGIRLFINQFQHRVDLMMAAGAVATLPVLLVFFAGQRWFVQGLAAGGVKG